MAVRDDHAAVADAITSASSVVIASHVDPDGDAIGSCLGLARAVDALGLPCAVVLAAGAACPVTYAFLPGAGRFIAAADAPEAPDVFVALDSPVLRRLGAAEPLARSAGTLVMIDHHPDAAAEGHIHLFDASAPATGTIVWDLLAHLDVPPDADIAACLYTALMTDTGRFSYSNTTPSALRTAAEMVEAGAQPASLFTAVYENRSAAAQRLIGITLERITLANGGHVAYSWLTAEDFRSTGALPEEAENLIDHVRALGGVDVVFLAKADGAEVHCSLRAKGDADVGAVARSLGGGGHRAAAGFTARGELTSVIETLLHALPGCAE